MEDAFNLMIWNGRKKDSVKQHFHIESGQTKQLSNIEETEPRRKQNEYAVFLKAWKFFPLLRGVSFFHSYLDGPWWWHKKKRQGFLFGGFLFPGSFSNSSQFFFSNGLDAKDILTAGERNKRMKSAEYNRAWRTQKISIKIRFAEIMYEGGGWRAKKCFA